MERSENSLCEMATQYFEAHKQVRLGAPQTTDDGVFTYVEFVGEEQQRITPLISFEKLWLRLQAPSYSFP